MAAQVLNNQEEQQQLPPLLIHRIPSFRILFKPLLQARFRLLDPLDSSESISSFLSTQAESLQLLLCIGPSPLNADTLRQLPSLQCVVCSSVGVDHVDLSECRRRGIAVTNAGSAFTEDVADYAVALLIDVLRRVSAADRYVRAGLWPLKGEYPLGSKSAATHHSAIQNCHFLSSKFNWKSGITEKAEREEVRAESVHHDGLVSRRAKHTGPTGDGQTTVGGKRVGILGLGGIGSEVAKRLSSFGCIVTYNSRKPKPCVLYPFYSNIHNLATNNDVLVVCCELTNETHHIIDKDVMTALGKEGVIINIGRGALVDEKELVQFLVKGEIRGAGLDVFENEPNVPKELFELDNVVMSPHKAVFTPESFKALEEVVMANLEAFISNKPLVSPVKLE